MKQFNENASFNEVENMIKYSTSLNSYIDSLEYEIGYKKNPSNDLWELASVLHGVHMIYESIDNMLVANIPELEFVDSVRDTDINTYPQNYTVFACVDDATGIEFFVVERPQGNILGYHKNDKNKIHKIFKK